jgi:hypothetical protein
MRKLFLIVVLATLSFSAMGKANPLMSISSSAPTQDSIFKQVFHVGEGEYDLYIISTCIIGIGEVSMGNFTLGGFNNDVAMLEQEFIFAKNGRTIKQYTSPARKIKATTASGHTYSFLETSVDCIEVISSKGDIYYSLGKVALQSMEPTMLLIYNTKGDLITYDYWADFKIVEIDGSKELSADYGIQMSEDEFIFYRALIDSATSHKYHFNEILFTNYYPPYNEVYKK